MVLLGGDWKQLLPVLTNANKNEGAEQVVLHSLKSWAGFSKFAKTKLTQNRRALNGEEEFVKLVASFPVKF